MARTAPLKPPTGRVNAGPSGDWLRPQLPPTECVWCADPSSDEEPQDPENDLCRSHQAEYEGLSLDGLDRMEAEERADRL